MLFFVSILDLENASIFEVKLSCIFKNLYKCKSSLCVRKKRVRQYDFQ